MDYFELSFDEFNKDTVKNMIKTYLRLNHEYYDEVEVTSTGEGTLGITLESQVKVASRFIFEERIQDYIMDSMRD